jgi:DNA-binding MarR family transcriptional regulator
VIQQVLSEPIHRSAAFGPVQTVPVEKERDYASELLRKLKEHGWIEDYKDPIDLKPTLKMTRAGKEIAQALSDLDNSRARTRQRNMRSAKKALAAFIASRDVDELLDAYDFASRVVQDLQDDIEYFRSLIQSLTREALEQKVAWSEFNEFIEKRFAKEYAVRLVADSAERHRSQIVEQLELIRALPSEVRIAVDANLLQRAAWLEAEAQHRSPTHWLVDRVEGMVEAACSLKLPMLRSEMNNYGARSPLGRAMGWLKERPESQRMALLDALSTRMATAEVRLTGAGVRWTVRDRELDHGPLSPLVPDEASRLDAAMRRAEAEAFAFSDQEVLAGLLPYLRDRRIALSQLPVGNAIEAIRVLHAVGAVRSQEGRRFLLARKRPETFDTPYFAADDYEVEADLDALAGHEPSGGEPS